MNVTPANHKGASKEAEKSLAMSLEKSSCIFGGVSTLVAMFSLDVSPSQTVFLLICYLFKYHIISAAEEPPRSTGTVWFGETSEEARGCTLPSSFVIKRRTLL